MLARTVLATLMWLAQSCTVTPVYASPCDEAVDAARSYDYVREETNNNDALEIREWLSWAGLGPGYPYCQAGYNYFLDAGFGYRVMPRSASVQVVAHRIAEDQLNFETVRPDDIAMGYPIPAGALVSFKNGAGNDLEGFYGTGHAEMALEWQGECGDTIGANTSPGAKGDQRGVSTDLTYGHQGVYYKRRCLGSLTKFPVVLISYPRECE